MNPGAMTSLPASITLPRGFFPARVSKNILSFLTIIPGFSKRGLPLPSAIKPLTISNTKEAIPYRYEIILQADSARRRASSF
jgi:hypothetical protein